METFKVDPVTVVKTVYNLSKPQGWGELEFRPGCLSDKEAITCIHGNRIKMDYVRGRACKFAATITDAGVEFDTKWWRDHSTNELEKLVAFLRKFEDGGG